MKAPTKSVNQKIDYQSKIVEPYKYIRAYKIKSNDVFLFIEPYETYKTCIKIIIPRINQLGQTIH